MHLLRGSCTSFRFALPKSARPQRFSLSSVIHLQNSDSESLSPTTLGSDVASSKEWNISVRMRCPATMVSAVLCSLAIYFFFCLWRPNRTFSSISVDKKPTEYAPYTGVRLKSGKLCASIDKTASYRPLTTQDHSPSRKRTLLRRVGHRETFCTRRDTEYWPQIRTKTSVISVMGAENPSGMWCTKDLNRIFDPI
ncbi:hypothetical protein B0H14DRAFT_390592 [Mycena olivaceomarginata]|nr:hypothetical protein B0H14DRAFT_390592 [Mycena olivaceomarginata]